MKTEQTSDVSENAPLSDSKVPQNTETVNDSDIDMVAVVVKAMEVVRNLRRLLMKLLPCTRII